ncbi:hypothetical protein Pyn_35022 [Prunus yedoensis var. nudiflora]|uniref:Uncharacterized protein n=1 Tax=Prunus yedoensis var. nudiflora TaxID=2094558 RepID=A0A314UXN5_PRUYE|nr:hypothetical protein Pyn_35022 [Prunus yedoensis var. nudiflora]
MYTREGAVRMVGVSGILRKEQEMWESTGKSLQDTFQDLNALMITGWGEEIGGGRRNLGWGEEIGSRFLGSWGCGCRLGCG